MRKYIATFILFFFSIGLLQAQPTVDGDLSDTDYVTMATKQNSNASFGSNIDVIEIVYYADDGNQTLFFGIKGKLDTGTDNAIGFWWNFSNQTGASSGDELGFDGAGHYMDGESGGTNDNFKADFEVDYMFAMNPGNGSTSVFYDAASKIGGNTSNFLGQSDQSGNQSTNSNSDGTLFTKDAITFAFNNGGSANQGFEMSIPYSELGITSLETFEAFAFIVSNSGFFSNVTVPGDLTGTDQPGFNADFTLADVNGDGSTDAGPFNSGPQTVGGENLTGSEGFRLLSIPTSNTTFADLLDPLWTTERVPVCFPSARASNDRSATDGQGTAAHPSPTPTGDPGETPLRDSGSTAAPGDRCRPQSGGRDPVRSDADSTAAAADLSIGQRWAQLNRSGPGNITRRSCYSGTDP